MSLQVRFRAALLEARFKRLAQQQTGLGTPSNRAFLAAQRVHLECHYGSRAHETIYGMVFGDLVP